MADEFAGSTSSARLSSIDRDGNWSGTLSMLLAGRQQEMIVRRRGTCWHRECGMTRQKVRWKSLTRKSNREEGHEFTVNVQQTSDWVAREGLVRSHSSRVRSFTENWRVAHHGDGSRLSRAWATGSGRRVVNTSFTLSESESLGTAKSLAGFEAAHLTFASALMLCVRHFDVFGGEATTAVAGEESTVASF
jgi:hypothetical protein